MTQGNKITLVIMGSFFSSFEAAYLESVTWLFFNVERHTPGKHYDKTSSIAVVSCLDNTAPSVELYIADGWKVIVDHLWESFGSAYLNSNHAPLLNNAQVHVALNKNWFWVNEYYVNRARNYDSYIPNRSYDKDGLMLCNQRRRARVDILNKLYPQIEKHLVGFRAMGFTLPGDSDGAEIDQRLFTPNWYNSTCYSIVIETHQDKEIFPTEKTFKPIAFEHPFIVFGQPGLLAHMRGLGFQTFNELFDESYDLATDYGVRMELVLTGITNFKKFRIVS